MAKKKTTKKYNKLQGLDQETIIGKNVIESLTIGMYEEAMPIYREYIQNAADQIDKAVELGILESQDKGFIEITIEKSKKSISIEDNATGIEQDKVVEILRNIATSTKRRGIDKGFRGIGRLGGLAYCDELIFETSAVGEPVKTTMTWSGIGLRQIASNPDVKISASKVIDQITSFTVSYEEEDKHYFKVTLQNVSKAELLDKKIVESYLQMSAPVPFNRGFNQFATDIANHLEESDITVDEYNIYLNGTQIEKAYTSRIYKGEGNSRKSVDEIFEVEFFQFHYKNQLLAWGWYGISKFPGVISRENAARGIRVRKSNIQIGDDQTLIRFHKEHRGNHYFFGEVHAVHMHLLPNSRRDYFMPNDVLTAFEKELKKLFQKKLHDLYHFASEARSAQKRISRLEEVKKEFKTKQKKGFTSSKEAEDFEEKIEKAKEEAIKAERKLTRYSKAIEEAEEESPKAQLFQKLTKDKKTKVAQVKLHTIKPQKEVKLVVDDLKVDDDGKEVLQKVFDIIDIVLVDRHLSTNLIEKIKEAFQ